MERYGGPAAAVKTNKENQKLAGLQNFLLTLQQGSDKEGEFRHPPLVHLCICRQSEDVEPASICMRKGGRQI